MKKTLSEEHILMMCILMKNETINKKVELAPGEGKSYARFDISPSGVITLGETKFRFWNQLIGCQRKLSFESWALAVWDALIDLSTGGNATALEEGLSVEIAKKAQREENYEWVVDRLMDCYKHVCNGANAPSAGGQDKNGSSVAHREVYVNGEPITININARNFERRIRIPDSTGKHFLNFGLGIVDLKVDDDK
jgi:hypothetical protein